MNLDDDPDISLSIPLKSLYEEFCCPICFNTIKDCQTTPCGHNFCSGCIKECLNRKHQCPCCNAAATINQLFKNHHHDRIVMIINREKEEASKQYFDKLIKKGNKEKNPNGNNNQQPKDDDPVHNELLSPVESLFHKHMKKSLTTYEEYYKDLEKKLEKTKLEMKEFFVKRMQEINNNYDIAIKKEPQQQAALKVKLDSDIAKVTAEFEFKLKELENSFQTSISLLLEAYEGYLNSLPSPSILPVAVSVIVPGKNITFKKIILKSSDSSADLKTVITKRLEELNNPLSKALDSKKNYFVVKRAANFNSNNNEGDHNILIEKEDILCNDEHRPLLQYQLKQGDILVLFGDVSLKSDKPKECFASTFVKGQLVTVDYYTCKDCNINWICKNCAEHCHNGHNISEYIMNHKPNWACCYCFKSKTCSLKKK